MQINWKLRFQNRATLWAIISLVVYNAMPSSKDEEGFQ